MHHLDKFPETPKQIAYSTSGRVCVCIFLYTFKFKKAEFFHFTDSNGNSDFWRRMKVSDGTESILSPNSRSGGDKLTCYRSLRRRRKGNNDVGRRGRWVGSELVVTPLRQWKFHDRDFIPAAAVSVSARKIAAGLWQFASTAGGARWRYGLFHQLGCEVFLNK